MALRIVFVWLIAVMLSTSIWADEAIELNPAHPNEYLVAEGDTLWRIAEKFLKKPAQWPKVWHGNPALKNPNLIYPGDTLTLTMADGKPEITISNSDRLQYAAGRSSGYEKLSPRIRETPLKQAIKTLPASAIDQFLSSPKVVGEDELEAAPYVLSFADEHLVAGAGDRIYVRSITESDNANFIVYRKGHAYIDPESQDILGYEAEFIATSLLQKPGDPATLLINKAMSEVRTGDRLMSNTTSELTLNYFPRAPEKPTAGSIISVLNGVSQIGQYNVVVLNKGTEEGLAIGHVLDIYQHGRILHDAFAVERDSAVTTPDELAGSLMVFRVFEHVSYALVMKASRAIHVLDKVQSP